MLLEVDSATRVQILNEAVSISHSANTFEKSMNPTSLHSDKRKIVGLTGAFNFGMATEKENQLLTWRGMGSTRLFLLKMCYMSSTIRPKAGFWTSNDDDDDDDDDIQDMAPTKIQVIYEIIYTIN